MKGGLDISLYILCHVVGCSDGVDRKKNQEKNGIILTKLYRNQQIQKCAECSTISNRNVSKEPHKVMKWAGLKASIFFILSSVSANCLCEFI